MTNNYSQRLGQFAVKLFLSKIQWKAQFLH